jgi:hypothetical protein
MPQCSLCGFIPCRKLWHSIPPPLLACGLYTCMAYTHAALQHCLNLAAMQPWGPRQIVHTQIQEPKASTWHWAGISSAGWLACDTPACEAIASTTLTISKHPNNNAHECKVVGSCTCHNTHTTLARFCQVCSPRARWLAAPSMTPFLLNLNMQPVLKYVWSPCCPGWWAAVEPVDGWNQK